MTEVKNGVLLLKDDSGNEGKGSYILLIELSEEQTIAIGSFKVFHFSCGYYAYVGSALGGIKSRLNRHLQRDKKLRWHIDYLLQKASLRDTIICETEDRVECTIAQGLNRQFEAIPGFGSSDCKCSSHLFFHRGEMKERLMVVLGSLGMKPRLVENLSKVGAEGSEPSIRESGSERLLRGACPEHQEILRFAQNDTKRRVRNDKQGLSNNLTADGLTGIVL